MFTTITEVKELTSAEVSQETIIMAQAIIESYIGRTEIEVTNARDTMMLARATAYQSAYMTEVDDIFQQVAVSSMTQYGSAMTFRADGVSPWVAPLAVLSCQQLSWRRMRSVKTGGLFDSPVQPSRWATE